MESIRLRRPGERRELLIAFASSLGVHALAFGLYVLFGVFSLALHRALLEELQARAELAASQEPPLLFVQVLPEQATPEPPEDAKYYSYANARAADPEPETEETTPKIAGSQEEVPKTEDTPEPLQPGPPLEPDLSGDPPPKPAPPEPEPVGDLALVNPDPEPPRRPRSLVEARLRRGLLAGQAMRQEGGARQRGRVSLDVKATPFGAYDGAVIAAIQKRWYDLLDESAFITRSGSVVVEFRMHPDGHITDLRVVEQDVGEVLALYCRKAVSDPAPYGPWPLDMKRLIGKEHRDVKFTFYYR